MISKGYVVSFKMQRHIFQVGCTKKYNATLDKCLVGLPELRQFCLMYRIAFFSNITLWTQQCITLSPLDSRGWSAVKSHSWLVPCGCEVDKPAAWSVLLSSALDVK